jgi:hypothetical protein
VGGCLPIAAGVVVIPMFIGVEGIVLGMTNMGDVSVVWAVVQDVSMDVGTGVLVGWVSSYALEPGISLTRGYEQGGEGWRAGAGPAGELTGTKNDDGCCFSPACTSFPFPEGQGV